MRVLVVYAHPNPASFCHALLRRVESALDEAGHEVRVKDLYAEGFNPVLSAAELGALNDGRVPEVIAHEQAALAWAEALVFIYPLWWFGTPAILKGWFDKTLTHGFAFEYGPGGQRGLLAARRALVLIAAGSGESEFESMQAKELLTRPVADGTLRFCGVDEVRAKVFYSVPGVTQEARALMLEEAAALASAIGEAGDWTAV